MYNIIVNSITGEAKHTRTPKKIFNFGTFINPLSANPEKMVKHTQTNRRQFADDLFECVWPFVNLALKGLKLKIFLIVQYV